MSSGGARTISLHNIRYELQWRGEELWAVREGREVLMGAVRPRADGQGWDAACVGYARTQLANEQVAREAVEATVMVENQGEIGLDITRRSYGEYCAIAQETVKPYCR